MNSFIRKALICLIPLFLLAAKGNDVRQKKDELTDLRSQIHSLGERLKKKNKTEKMTLKDLQTIEEQNHLVNRLINGLHSEEQAKDYEIGSLHQRSIRLSEDILRLKANYSNYIVWFYKHGGISSLKYIFDASSINQAMLRYKYLAIISRKNRGDYLALLEKMSDMRKLEARLGLDKQEKHSLAEEKEAEQKSLLEKKANKERLVRELKRDKNSIAQEIEQKRRAEARIQGMISYLVAKESTAKGSAKEQKIEAQPVRTEQKAAKVQKYLPDKKVPKIAGRRENRAEYASPSGGNFASQRGHLLWPVHGRVVRKSGENENSRLKTVTINYGIDIQAAGNSPVCSVADGVVSAIDWIPGFGSIIIITHAHNYRTVYGHVSSIAVNKGSHVSRGSLVGHISESLEGNILHFEIWNERQYQNPESWLSR